MSTVPMPWDSEDAFSVWQGHNCAACARRACPLLEAIYRTPASLSPRIDATIAAAMRGPRCAQFLAAGAPAIATQADLVAALGDGWVADSDPNGWQADYSELAIYTLLPSECDAVADLLRYIVTGPLHGEWWDGCGVEERAGHCYRFALDTTKFSRDDVPDAWDAVKGWLSEGSPVRLTNRAGAATKGTRKHNGLGPVLLAWR